MLGFYESVWGHHFPFQVNDDAPASPAVIVRRVRVFRFGCRFAVAMWRAIHITDLGDMFRGGETA